MMNKGRAEEIYNRIVRDGEHAINEFISTRASEELFLDFKRSADNGSGKKLHDTDRNNLSEAISGFGNSEGGVIVWGIDCSKSVVDGSDVASAKFPIYDVKRFESWVNGVISGCTIPPHNGVQNHALTTKDGKNGFIVTFVPKSFQSPLQVVHNFKFLIRAGSSFVPIHHGVLAGMFGRRPQAWVFHMFASGLPYVKGVNNQVSFQLGFMIANEGPGVAKDLFMVVKLISSPGKKCKVLFEPSRDNHWIRQFSFGRIMSVMSIPDFRLAPSSHVMPFVLKLDLLPPIEKELKIEGICGSGESPPVKFLIENDAQAIVKIYDEYVSAFRNNAVTDKLGREYVDRLFKSEIKEDLSESGKSPVVGSLD